MSEVLVLDNSMIRSFMKCPREYYYLYELQCSLKDHRNSAAITFGSAFHFAVEQESLSQGLEAFKELWISQNNGSPEKAPYTIQNGLSLVEWFWAQPKHGKPWLKEVGFVVPLEHILYGGKIDILEESSLYGGLAVVDYKTTTRVTTCWIEQAVNSKQIKGYLASAWILGYKPKIGLIRVVTIQKTKEIGYTLSDIPVQSSEKDIESWLESTETQGKWINSCKEKNFFPMSGNCGSHYESCQFLSLCLSGRGEQFSKEQVLEHGNYQETIKWEPWYEGKVQIIDQPSLRAI